MRILGMVVAITVVGCGGGGGTIDGAPSDGPDPADARVDAMPPDPGELVIDSLLVPTSTTEVQSYGMDIDSDQPDGDLGIDNQLGGVFAVMASMGIDAQAAVTVAVDRGRSITLIDLDPADGTLHSYPGINPNPAACSGPTDTVCRHHLDGSGGFDIAPGAPTGAMPTTTVTTTTGGPGTAVLQLAIIGSAVATLELSGARFIGTVDATGITDGRLAGAVPAAAIDSEIVPAIGGSMRAITLHDCPSPIPPNCYCMAGSQGSMLLSTFDADDDCSISDDELRADPLISGFLTPDVTIDGNNGLSIGVRLTAVPGSFTPP